MNLRLINKKSKEDLEMLFSKKRNQEIEAMAELLMDTVSQYIENIYTNTGNDIVDMLMELDTDPDYHLYFCKKYFVFSYLGCIVINTPTCNLITDMGLHKNKPEKQKIAIQFESKRKKYTIKLFLTDGQIKNSIVIFPNSLYRKTSYIDGVVHKVCVFRIKDNKETGRTEVVQFPIDHKDDLFFKMKDFISNIKRVI